MTELDTNVKVKAEALILHFNPSVLVLPRIGEMALLNQERFQDCTKAFAISKGSKCSNPKFAAMLISKESFAH